MLWILILLPWNVPSVNITPDESVNSLSEIIESNLLNEGDCKSAMKEYLKDLREKKLWALEMFDATAKTQSGVLSGNIINMGTFTECIGIREKLTYGRTFNGKYCLGEFISPQNPAKPHLKWGICIPEECKGKDVEHVYSKWISQGDYLGQTNNSFLEVLEDNCQTYETANPKFDTAGIVGVSILGAIAMLVVLSTCYEFLANNRKCVEVLKSFSLISNTKLLMKTNTKNNNNLTCLDGMRFLSILWIVLVHERDQFMERPIVNSEDVEHWKSTAFYAFCFAGAMAVETFFVVSGFLVAYTNYAKKEIKLFKNYLHRYIRLTPVLAAAILVSAILVRYFGSGPNWTVMMDIFEKSCRKYWWTDLLYIQNYVNPDNMCLGNTWYLAVDMQMFLLSPLLLYMSNRCPKIGYAIMTTAATISLCWSFKVAYDIKTTNHVTAHDEIVDMVVHHYYLTHTRCSSWLIGFIFGQLFSTLRQRQVHINQFVAGILWTLSTLALLCCIFYKPSDKLLNVLIMVLGRPMWSLSVCWLIFACAFGRAGKINSFLSLPFFQIANKLTYSLYVTHFMIMHADFLLLKNSREFGYFIFLKEFLGACCYSLILAIVWMYAFEAPAVNLEKFVLKR